MRFSQLAAIFAWVACIHSTAALKFFAPLEGENIGSSDILWHESLSVRGDYTRLRVHLEKAVRDETNFTVVVIGGSATAGAGCGSKSQVTPLPGNFLSWVPQGLSGNARKASHRHNERLGSWSARLTRYLKPLLGPRLTVLNAAVHARGIEYHLLKAFELFENTTEFIGTLQPKVAFPSTLSNYVSLIVIDTSVNDRGDGVYTAPIMEGYVRFLLNLKSRPAVMFLDLPTGELDNVKPNAIGGRYPLQHRIHQAVAGYYNLPVISTSSMKFGGSRPGAEAAFKLLKSVKKINEVSSGHIPPEYHELAAAVLSMAIYGVLAKIPSNDWSLSELSKSADIQKLLTPPKDLQTFKEIETFIKNQGMEVELPPKLWLRCDEPKNVGFCRMAENHSPVFYHDYAKSAEGGDNSLPTLEGSGWWYGEDAKEKPGWVTCDALGIAERSLTVAAKCGAKGELYVGYLASYSPNMGTILIQMKNKKGAVLRNVTIDSFRPSVHESTFQTHLISEIKAEAAFISFKAIPRGGAAQPSAKELAPGKAGADPGKAHTCVQSKFKLLSLSCF